MIGRIGNDVLRAVAILGGLVVAGALLLSTADTRVAQFTFGRHELGRTDGPLPVSIAIDARSRRTYVAGCRGRGSTEPLERGAIRKVALCGDLATVGSGGLFAAASFPDGSIRLFRSDRTSTRDSATAQVRTRTALVHLVGREDGLLVASTVAGGRLRVWTSADDGRSLSPGGTIGVRVAAAGPVIVGPFGSLFAGVVTPAGTIGVAASADGGETWSARGITTVAGVDRVPPSIAVDDAATLYVAFTTTVAGAPRVSIAHTRDLGLTWSEPVTATPPGSHSPQLVAGSLGKVGLAYLHGDELVYRHTIEALLARPFWTEHLVARGVRCAYPCERAPYELTLTLQSRALLVARARGRLVVAEQVSGSGVR